MIETSDLTAERIKEYLAKEKDSTKENLMNSEK